MGLSHQHEMHKRRAGRNLGVGLVLAAFIAVVFGLTIVKVGTGDFAVQPRTEGAADGN